MPRSVVRKSRRICVAPTILGTHLFTFTCQEGFFNQICDAAFSLKSSVFKRQIHATVYNRGTCRTCRCSAWCLLLALHSQTQSSGQIQTPEKQRLGLLMGGGADSSGFSVKLVDSIAIREAAGGFWLRPCISVGGQRSGFSVAAEVLTSEPHPVQPAPLPFSCFSPSLPCDLSRKDTY